MSDSGIQERTIALAAVLQACLQVQSLARHGTLDQSDYDAALHSILTLDAVSSEAIFGGIGALHRGLSALADGILVSPKADATEVLRYTMSLLHLQRQLFSDAQALELFSKQVEGLRALDRDELPAECASIYQHYVSVLTPQIIVNGDEQMLQRAEVPTQIRTLLLAGIRASVLWQQKGGGRFNLLWQRTRMQNAAKALLRRVAVH